MGIFIHVYWKFHLFSSERVVKTDNDLTKLWPKINWHIFFWTQCTFSSSHLYAEYVDGYVHYTSQRVALTETQQCLIVVIKLHFTVIRQMKRTKKSEVKTG